jgi:hypothetical protein
VGSNPIRTSVIDGMHERQCRNGFLLACGVDVRTCASMRVPLFSSRISRVFFFGVITAASIFVSRAAMACGASTGGVAGLSACSVDAHEEQIRSKWHVGASYSYTSTGIRFDNVRPDEIRHGVLATLESSPFPELSVQVGVGSILGGYLLRHTADGVPAAKYQIYPGPILAIGGSYRFIAAKGARPFVLATLGLTMSASQTRLEGHGPNGTHALYNAFDMRAGGVIGWNIARLISPYAVGRAFGGPVYWTYQGQSTTGTDVHHFQIGAGLGIALGKRFDVFVEGVPLGEVGVSAGIGASL